MAEVINYKVYVHINKVNGKIYIGLTKQPVLRRWNNGNAYKKCPLFWRAIEKYGWDGFQHIVVKDGLSKEEAANMERSLIAIFNTTDPMFGYNCDDGGFTGSPSEIVKEKLRAANIGKKYPLSTRLKHSIASKKREVQFTNFARQRSKEVRMRAVRQYDKNRNFLREWDSITDAATGTGTRHQNIVRCCQGKAHTCGGYYWSYADSGIVEPKKEYQIVQIDAKDNHVIATYESIQVASSKTKIPKGNICAVCNGSRNQAGGYKWERKGVLL